MLVVSHHIHLSFRITRGTNDQQQGLRDVVWWFEPHVLDMRERKRGFVGALLLFRSLAMVADCRLARDRDHRNL